MRYSSRLARSLVLLFTTSLSLSAQVSFTELPAGLYGLRLSDVAWGDYDNDGDLDLAVMGDDNTNRYTLIYRNDAGSFMLAANPPLGVRDGDAVWGDYDRDGDLDLFLTGGFNAKLLRNDGGSFVEVSLGWSTGDMQDAASAFGDFDNDGDLDILATGMTNSRIYRNEGGAFTLASTLDGVLWAAAAWVDYDLDGDLDVSLCGYSGTAATAITDLYRNDNGSFVKVTAGIVDVQYGGMAWGDYDNDGDPDLCITGWAPSIGNITYLYRNDAGTFVNTGAALPPLQMSSAAWGDCDNDGDLDLLLSGINATRQTLLYLNSGGIFALYGTSLEGVREGTAVWGDYDGDGDLDIALSGEGVSGLVSKIYTNGLASPNAPPSAPSNLQASVSGSNVTLSWLRASDPQTPLMGIGYNLRVGTSPGAADVVSPMANLATGQRRLPDWGSTGSNASWTLRGMAEGTYYWSVQAVDGGFAGSSFAGEQQFSVNLPPGAPTQLVVSPGNGTAELRWNVNPESDVQYYAVYQGSASGLLYFVNSTASRLDTTYMFTGLDNDSLYRYVVSAVDNGFLEGPFTDTVRAVPTVEQGRALAFNGTDGSAVSMFRTSLALNGTATIETWFNAAAEEMNQREILWIDAGGGNQALDLRLDDFGNIIATAYLGGPVNAFTSGVNYKDERWHHAALRIDGTQMTLFVDGNPVAINSGSAPFAADSAQVLIGQDANGLNFFHGMIDEVRVWSTARSDADLRSALAWPVGPDAPGLAALFHLDEPVGDVAYEATAGKAHALFNGGVGHVASGAMAPREVLQEPPVPFNEQIVAAWRTGSDPDISGYRVFAGNTPGPTAVAATTASATDTTVTLGGLQNGRTYYLRVAAVDAVGNQGAYSNELSTAPVGLVAFYPFSGNATDATGNGYDAVNNGATLSADRFNAIDHAFHFDGLPNRMSAPLDLKIVNGHVATIVVWIKKDEMITAGLFVAAGDDDSHHWGVGVQNGLQWVHSRNGDSFVERTGGTMMAAGEWQCAAFVLTGTTVGLYLNGEPNGVATELPEVDPSSDLHFGSRGFDTWTTFTGELDDIRIYNRALTAEEIHSLYVEGSWPPPAAPAGLAATAGDEQVTLTWVPNVEPDLMRYRIYGSSSSPATVLIDSAQMGESLITLGGLSNGTSYFFRITAVDSGGNESAFSSEVSAAPVALPIHVSTAGNDANDGSIGAPLRTIQAALSRAAAGDSIKVAAGIYPENLTTAVRVILCGGYSPSFDARNIFEQKSVIQPSTGNAYADTKSSTIDGFHFDGSAGAQKAIYVDGGHAYVTHNAIYKFYVSSGAGIQITSAASGTVLNNTLAENRLTGGGVIFYALYILGNVSGGATLRNNIAIHNDVGLYVAPAGVAAGYNCVVGNDYLDYDGTYGMPGTGDLPIDPRIVNAGIGDMRLRGGSPAIDAGDPADPVGDEPAINGGRINVGSYGGTSAATPSDFNPTTHVAITGDDANDGSIGAPLRTIQAGIDRSLGDTIKVAEGVYPESIITRSAGHLFGGYDTTFAEGARDLHAHRTTLQAVGATMLTDAFGLHIDGLFIDGMVSMAAVGLDLQRATRISHCTLVNVKTTFAHAIEVTAPVELINNTFYNNYYSLYLESSAAGSVIKNNIFANNNYTYYNLAADGMTSYNILYTSPKAGSYTAPGIGELSLNPMFRNAAALDFRVLEASPAVNAGDPADPPGAEPPPGDVRIDMGAFGGTALTPYYPPVPLPPLLALPADGASGEPRSLTVKWYTSPEVSSYRLQVATDPSFTTGIIVDDSTQTDTLEVLTGLTAASTYYWRVNAKVTLGTSDYSTVYAFTTAPSALHVSTFGDDINDGSPVAPLRTIQAALNRMTPGDTIRVEGGTYAEALVTVVSGHLRGGYSTSFVEPERNLFEHATIIQAVSGTMWYDNVGVHVDGVVFDGGLTIADVGLELRQPVTVAHSVVRNVKTTFAHGVEVSAPVVLLNNTFYNCYYGIELYGGAVGSNIRNNLITHNNYGFYNDAANGLTSYNGFYSNTYGNYSTGAIYSASGVGEFTADPKYRDAASGDYRLYETSPALNAGDPSDPVGEEPAPGNSRIDLGCFGGTALSPYYPPVPPPPSLALPANGALSQPRSLTVKWRQSPEVTSYRLQVATDPDFMTNVVVDDSTQVDTLEVLSDLASATTYYWRVNAKVTLGTSDYSTVFSFATAPSVLHVATSGSDLYDGSVTAPLRYIQTALSRMTPGDTVKVAEGTYAEGLVTVNAGVLRGGYASSFSEALRDPFAHATILQAVSTTMLYDNKGVSVDGVWFDGMTSVAEYAIDARQPAVYQHNVFHNVKTTFAHAINAIAPVTVINNTFTNCYYALYLYNTAAGSVIKNNIFSTNNYTYYNLAGDGLTSYNILYSSPRAGSYTAPGVGELSLDPKFVDLPTRNLRLQSSSPAINAGDPNLAYNDPDGSRNDMGAFFYDAPPAAPAGLVANPDTAKLHLSWTISPEPDAASYRIYAGTAPAPTALVQTLGSPEANGWTYEPLEPRTYYIRVTAVDLKGNESAYSIEVSATPFATPGQRDSLALAELYMATNGPAWTNHENWLTGPVGTWYGVTLEGDRVAELRLHNNNLAGSIPPIIGDLTALIRLEMGGNALGGPLPATIGNMASLQSLLIWNSGLTGTIPPELGNLSSLVQIYLDGNQLTGAIPVSLASLSNLSSLVLHTNLLSGSIPPQLGMLSHLVELQLGWNQLSGDLPIELTGLEQLFVLDVRHNQLTGMIPPEVGRLSNLRFLFLNDNQFGGALPDSVARLSILEQLFLNNNRFDALPDLSPLTQLASLGVSGNMLTMGDLEANAGVASTNYEYHPQDSIGIERDTTVVWKSNLFLSVPYGSPTTLYHWLHDGVEIGVAAGGLEIPSVDSSMTGIYSWWATSSLLPGLTLYGRPVHVFVEPTPYQRDSLALVDLYLATNGPAWTSSANWLTGPVETWYGITVAAGRVSEIVLSNNNLVGPIPSSIANLTAVWKLDLGYNRLSGGLPAAIGQMSALNTVIMWSCELSGPLPAELGNLSNLMQIYLQGNQISGVIPSSFGALAALNVIDLSGNQLTGAIPPELGTMASLTYLTVGNNQLTGALPVELTNLTQLHGLDVQGNLLTGPIPPEIGRLNLLTHLYLQNNRFTGAVPDSIRHLSLLQYLYLQNNLFDHLPDLTPLTSLAALDVAGNLIGLEDLEPNAAVSPANFNYSPQDSVGVERDTTVTWKSNLFLSVPYSSATTTYHWMHDGVEIGSGGGGLEVPSVDSSMLGNYSWWATSSLLPDLTLYGRPVHVYVEPTPLQRDSLALVDLYNSTNGPGWTNKANWLTGPLSTWFGVYVSEGRVRSVTLYENNLQGPLPPSIGNLDSLTWLELPANGLTSIPAEIAELHQLRTLRLYANPFHTAIPSAIFGLTNLRELHLASCQLTGPIPAAIANLSNLVLLYLHDNALTGSIPTELGSLTELAELFLYANSLTGAIPPELGQLPLQRLYLHGNALTGPIPLALTNLQGLTGLDLSDNQLSGEIPPEIGRLVNLGELHLYANRLTGAVPDSVTRLTNLSSLWLHNNQLDRLPNLSALVQLGFLDVRGNRFTLADLEPNASIASGTFLYAPQDSIGVEGDTTVIWKSNLFLPVPYGSATTTYHWMRNGVEIGSAAGGLEIPSVDSSMLGSYSWRATSSLLPDLTLYGRPVHVFVQPTPLQLDSLALVDLYDATNGSSWWNNTNWLTGPLHSWAGVVLNDGRVFGLHVPTNNLKGTIPASLGQLEFLNALQLSSNQLSGSIPASLGSLTRLASLELQHNQLSGSIPSELGNFTGLSYCDLRGNLLSGSIPASLGAWTGALFIGLGSNQLSGSIPSTFGALQALNHLSLESNQLEGPIPVELTNLHALSILDLGQNRLSGEIPAAIGRLHALVRLVLSQNELSGPVPDSLAGLSGMQYLYLADNQLTHLPDLSAWTNLVQLRLENNRLTFGDVEPIAAFGIGDLVYAPQESIGVERDTVVLQGSSVTLTANADGVHNQYQWLKDGVDLPLATSSALVLPSTTPSDDGSYVCRVTNTLAVQLTLITRPIRLHVSEILPGEFVTDASTVLLMHMNEPGGTDVADVSGAGNHGVASGTAVEPGRFGLARRFTGGGENIRIPKSTSTHVTGSMTLEAWINPAGGMHAQPVIEYGASAIESVGVHLHQHSSFDRPYVNFVSDDSPNTFLMGAGGLIQVGRWYHIAATYDQLSGDAKVWLNGQLVASSNIGSLTLRTDRDLYLGLRLGYESLSYEGLIDEVRISNVARSPQEFNLQLPPTHLAATATGTTVNLSWQNGGGGVGLLRYKIYRGADSTSLSLIDSTTGTSYSNAGLTQGVTYFYRVTAVDATEFEGVASFASSATTTAATPPPGTPTLSGPADGTVYAPLAFTLSWNAVSGADSYRLQVATDAGFASIVRDSSGITGTTYSLSGLANSATYYWRVSASNVAGSSSFSTAWSFTTIMAIPGVPALTSPADAAVNVLLTPTLTWNVSSGAVSYHLQVATDAAFTLVVVNDSGLTTTSRQTASLNYQTTYYWRVRAKNPAGVSAFSSARTFTITSPAPPTPSLASPADGAVDQSLTPTLVWHAATTATSYRLQVAPISDFSALNIDSPGLTDTAFTIPNATLNSGQVYYWRVLATNAGGSSSYSGAWSFSTLPGLPAQVTLQSPADGATNRPLTLSLVWNSVATATSYQLQVSTVSSFSTFVLDTSGSFGTSMSVTGLTNGTTYYWRVRAANTSGSGSYSATWSFTTLLAPPEIPTLVSPINGAVDQPTVVALVWRASTGASSYDMVVSTDPTFATSFTSQSNLTDTTFTVSGLANSTTYYWQVNAKNASTTVTSGNWQFTTVIAAPAQVALMSPSNGASDVPFDGQVLGWNGVANATSYHVQVATDAGFMTKIVDDSTVTATSKQIFGLAGGIQYHWRVRAKNVGGYGEYSAAWTFTTQSAIPEVPTLASPADGAIDQPLNVTLAWNASSGAASYDVQVSSVPTFETQVFMVNTVSTTVQPTGLVNSMLYYWRVRAVNGSGPSAYAASRHFATIIAPPDPVTLVSPANGAAATPNTITLVWNAAARASTYDVEVSTNTGFSPLVASAMGLTSTSHEVTSLSYLTQYFWRVRSNNAGGSAISSAWHFTTKPEPPAVPTLASPSSAATDVSLTPSLAWEAVTGATGYELQVAGTSAFTPPLLVDAFMAGTSHPIGAGVLQPLTEYHWRVRAYTVYDTSAFSAVWTFTTVMAAPGTPLLVSPVAGAQNQSTSLKLTWQKAGPPAGAPSTYHLQVATSVNFLSGFQVDEAALVDTSYQLSGLNLNTTYYWRVSAANNGGTSAFTSGRSFTTVSVPPSAPSSLTATAQLGRRIRLEWIPGSTNEENFRVERRNGGAFSEIASQAAGSTEYVDSLLIEGTSYTYRVRAYNVVGFSSYTPEASATTFDETAPAAPISLSTVGTGWTRVSPVTVTWLGPSDPSGIVRAWYALNSAPSAGAPGTSVTVTGGAASIPITVQGAVTIYVYLEDGAGNRNVGAVSSTGVLFDSVPPSLLHDSTSVATFNTGSPQGIAIAATASDAGSGIQSSDLQYRRAGTSWASAPTLGYPSPAGGSAIIPQTFLQANQSYGIDYRVLTRDVAGNSTITPTFSIRIQVGQVTERRDPQSGSVLTQPSVNALPASAPATFAYRMFSVPLQLNDQTPQDILENRTGLPAYNDESWRFYKLKDNVGSNASDPFDEYPTFRSQSVVTPGRAFLLILKSGIVIKTGPGLVLKAEDYNKNGIALNAGYNFVGNPFAFDVPKDSLRLADGSTLSGKTAAFIGVGGEQSGWRLNPDTLKAWEGWVVKVPSATSLRFDIADRGSMAVPEPLRAQAVEDPGESWRIQVDAKRTDNGVVDLGNIVGIDGRASEGEDVFDMFEPPLVGSGALSVGFETEEGVNAYDVRSNDQHERAWSMVLRTPEPRVDVTLTFRGIEASGQPVYLFDLDTRSVSRLVEGERWEVNSRTGVRKFRLVVGSEAFAEQNSDGISLVPKATVLHQNFPNPFNPATNLSFSVERTGTATVTIFNVLGQEVTTLFNGAATAGRLYEVTFDARNLPSGVYIARLETGKERRLQKMILAR